MLVKWTTSSEKNNDYFTLMHSTDGTQFNPISHILGFGNSSLAHNYSFLHENCSGINYYQLQQTDYDKTSTKSDIITAYVNSQIRNVFVFQKGDRVEIEIELNSPKKEHQFNIQNISRQIVYGTILSDEIRQRVSVELTPGAYFLSINSNEARYTQSFVVE